MTETLERLQAALGDRYTLKRELGRGGMATVYLAQDLRHERPVALKVLHSDLAATLGPDRFLREIRLAARLQHPHILSVHDSGESAGWLWFTMPYVEGESLRDRLTRERQLPVEEALRLTREVALALDFAHRHGVVHRDIKPENILLVDGQALVADFGIGRALDAAEAEDRLTQTGMVVGTPLYMSPEQATGQRELDGRTDVYSLGVVLFEMLAGEPPYTGATPQAILAKRLSEPVPHLRAVRDIPVEVEHALIQALARVPADRYQSAAQFAAALEHPANSELTGAPRVRRRPAWLLPGGALAILLGAAVWFSREVLVKREPALRTSSLAILPFRVIGDGQQVWREGMVDLLAINLDGAAGLTTIHPRTILSRWHRDLGSSEGSADQEAALQVARSLGARYSVSGTLLVSGPRLRITAEAQDVLTGGVRGRSSVEGSADSVPALVDRLSLEMLRAGLLSGGRPDSVMPNAGRLATTSVTALKAYLDGERAFRRSEPEQAKAAFQRAVEADSTFALAHYRLAAARAWTVSPHLLGTGPADSIAPWVADQLPRRDRLLFAAQLALEERNPAAIGMLQKLTASYPDDAEGWYLLGEAYYHLGRYNFIPLDRFRAAERRAISLDPGLTPAYLHLTEDAFTRLDSAEAENLIRTLQRIAPASPKTTGLSIAFALSWGDSSARRSARSALDTASTLALLTAKHATNVTPDLWRQTLASGLALAHEARRSSRSWQGYGGAGMAYTLRGRIREAIILYDSASATGGASDDPAIASIYLAILGVADSSTGNDAAKMLALLPGSDPFILRTLYSATRGRFEDVERAAIRLERGDFQEGAASQGVGATTCGRAQAKVVRAFAAGFRDGPKGIASVREAATLRWIPRCDLYLEPQRLLLIRLLVESGRGVEAVPYFNGFDPFSDYDALVPLEFYRGRVAEQLSERQQAIYHYSRLVSWLDRADPHLQPMRAEARQALSRLVAESGTGP